MQKTRVLGLWKVLCAMAVITGAPGNAGAASDAALIGQVTDLRGKPLAGVTVSAQSWQSVPLGSAHSDAQGRFRIGISKDNATSDITLSTEPPGYLRYALTGFKADGQPIKLALTRVVDAAYLQELLTETDAARFSALAADLLNPSLGTVGESLPMETIFPVLGALRPRLRAYVSKDLAQLSRLELAKDQHRAMLLLSWWSDPLDDALVDAWAVGQRNVATRPKTPCRGATVDEAWRSWEKLHFQKEGYGPGKPPPWARGQVTLSPTGDHAIVKHEVRYAHWGYSQLVIVVRTRDSFEVRLIIAHEHWHGRD